MRVSRPTDDSRNEVNFPPFSKQNYGGFISSAIRHFVEECSSEEIKFAISSQFQHTHSRIYLRAFRIVEEWILKGWRLHQKIPSGNSSNGNDWNSFDFLSAASVRLIKSENTLQKKMCSRLERHNTWHYHSWHLAEDFRCCLFCVFNPETYDRLIATLSQGRLFSTSTGFQKEKKSWHYLESQDR